jgi:hypothetical protein
VLEIKYGSMGVPALSGVEGWENIGDAYPTIPTPIPPYTHTFLPHSYTLYPRSTFASAALSVCIPRSISAGVMVRGGRKRTEWVPHPSTRTPWW